jgi:hypothetical protein
VRPGAGRPKGSKDRVTVGGILDALDARTGGQSYEDILIEDFLASRLSNDAQLTHKYHTLLSNKFIANLNEVMLEDNTEIVSAKQLAFAEAIKQIINKDKDDDNASN